MIKQHEKWLHKAHDDLSFAHLGLENQYYSQLCFLSQQCIEKCIKGYMVYQGMLYERTHNLIKLLHTVADLEEDLKSTLTEIRFIDEFYIPARYPDGIPGGLKDQAPTEKHAKLALDTAQRVYEIVSNKIRKQ